MKSGQTAAVPQHFRHRLERNPSLRDELRQSIVFASVPLFILAVGGWGWWTDSASAPRWVRFVAPVFLLVTLGFVWNIVLRARRVLSGRVPVVEVDTQPWHAGAPVQVRIAHPDAASFESFEAHLVAESTQVERVPLTTADSGGWRFTEAVRHHMSLLTVPGEALRGAGPLDRVVNAVVPLEAAGNQWRWQVLLVGRVARGVPSEDRYPVRIESN